MGLFTKQRHDMSRLHYILKLAFDRIKRDMHNLFHWVNYFQEKHKTHDERLEKIESKLATLPDSRREIAYDSQHKERIDRIH